MDGEVDEANLTPARRWYLANQAVERSPGEPAGLVGRAAAFLGMGAPQRLLSP